MGVTFRGSHQGVFRRYLRPSVLFHSHHQAGKNNRTQEKIMNPHYSLAAWCAAQQSPISPQLQAVTCYDIKRHALPHTPNPRVAPKLSPLTRNGNKNLRRAGGGRVRQDLATWKDASNGVCREGRRFGCVLLDFSFCVRSVRFLIVIAQLGIFCLAKGTKRAANKL